MHPLKKMGPELWTNNETLDQVKTRYNHVKSSNSGSDIVFTSRQACVQTAHEEDPCLGFLSLWLESEIKETSAKQDYRVV